MSNNSSKRTTSFRKAWKDGNRSAYDVADSLEDIIDGYKRCRTIKSFIITDQGIEQHEYRCDLCGEEITVESGNRGHFSPRSKAVALYHYTCAWSVTLAPLGI